MEFLELIKLRSGASADPRVGRDQPRLHGRGLSGTMRRHPAFVPAAVLACALARAVRSAAQTRTAEPRTAARAAPPPAAAKAELADLTCPTPLGVGVRTKLAFCDVMSGRDPADGILITLPPHGVRSRSPSTCTTATPTRKSR